MKLNITRASWCHHRCIFFHRYISNSETACSEYRTIEKWLINNPISQTIINWILNTQWMWCMGRLFFLFVGIIMELNEGSATIDMLYERITTIRQLVKYFSVIHIHFFFQYRLKCRQFWSANEWIAVRDELFIITIINLQWIQQKFVIPIENGMKFYGFEWQFEKENLIKSWCEYDCIN